MSIKKALCIVSLCLLAGCTADNSNEGHLEIKEDIAAVQEVEKDVYACGDEEFFFIERLVGKRFVNFIYNSYSSPLTKKPSSTELYSDGVYNLSFLDEKATVKFNQEIVLQDCEKIK